MKYDDASWHYGGDFSSELPEEAGATHIGMFAAWACLNGLAGTIHLEDGANDLQRLAARDETPGTWFLKVCDGKLTDEDFNDEGNGFARSYYAASDGQLLTAPGSYLADYSEVFDEVDEIYAVPDTWASFDRLKAVVDERWTAWNSSALIGFGR